MSICWEGFKSFFKIGCFTLGGGYAMIPLIEEEVVTRKRWITKEDFLDLMSLSQALPGVFAVNFSIYIGHKMKGFRGAVAFALGTALPSFLIILLIALCFQNYSKWRFVEAIFKGIRPAVVALIAAPCINLGRAAHIKITNVWLPVLAALLIWLGGVSPVYIILLVGLGGFMYGKLIKSEEV